MKFIADFHIHSHYSIATSKKLIPEYLDYWAQLKGIQVIGTGDCIHPGWSKELKEKLEPAGNGLYRLKPGLKLDAAVMPQFASVKADTFFILTTEISCIYKKNGKVRKVHNVCVFPDFETLENLQSRLDKIGNIRSDGRPILGLDSKDLLSMVLDSGEGAFLIPAHIWTPWFSVLGSKSGFDSVDECYEDLTQHIFAVETGLSSDPPMNWACSFLDKFRLVSNSDAHSPEKLGREANLFDTELSYQGIYKSLKEDKGFLGTIEFFPQEGKYHYDGHRKCNICWDPLETIKNQGICPKCKKEVTKGVMYRVAELADREKVESLKEFYSITSLPDIIAEVFGKKTNSKIVQKEYFNLLEKLGSDFHILLSASLSDLKSAGGDVLSRAIDRLRKGKVYIQDGYDGEFGRITVFAPGEIESVKHQTLFEINVDSKEKDKKNKKESSMTFDVQKFKKINNSLKQETKEEDKNIIQIDSGAIDKQKAGIEHKEGVCMVVAGPGSGKTRILTERIIYLMQACSVAAENILAITFSHKAAEEMRDRVQIKLSEIKVNISTFHAFGLSILKKYYEQLGRSENFYIIDEVEKKEIIIRLSGEKNKGVGKLIEGIASCKQGRAYPVGKIEDLIKNYNQELKSLNAFDLDDLISLPVDLFFNNPEILVEYRNKYRWILIDEYQDINGKQYELVRMLSGQGNPNLFVIGDPDQAIYGFRGSDVRYLEQLKTDYPKIKLIQLDKSYRCPEIFLRAAGQVLKKEEFLSGIATDIKINIQQCDTEKSEADWIAAQIEKMMGGVRSFSINSGIADGSEFEDIESFSDFAVLCRTSSMFNELVKAFHDHGIAYQIIGLEPFYQKEPVSSLIRQFRKIYYGQDSDLKVSKELLREIKSLIAAKQTIEQILNKLGNKEKLSLEQAEQVTKFVRKFNNSYAEFFQIIATRQGVDDYNIKEESVSLMTIHAAKGLEFKTVFIAGCEEKILPFEVFTKKDEDEIKEEERIFYVGITRSKKYLFLTHAKRRLFKGRILQQKRSVFLNRLEKNLLQVEKRAVWKRGPKDIQLSFFE